MASSQRPTARICSSLPSILQAPAALQETRAKESGFWAPSDDFRFIAAGEDGCLGCEIWISKLLPIATSGLGKVVPKLEHFTVLHQDPRALFIRLQCSPLDLTFVCVHAPHSGVEKEVRAKWWQRLSLLWQRFVQGRYGFLLGDFNARIGESDVSGSLDASVMDFNGGLAVDFLRQHGLTLPSTFPTLHAGSSTTWVSPKGLEHRIDFIATPESFLASVVRSWVEPSITCAHAVVDDFCVLLDLHWRQASVPPVPTWTPQKTVRLKGFGLCRQ